VGGERGALVSLVAALFPGQGSQHEGMGRALMEAFPESAEIFRRADAALRDDLSGACFRGPEDLLARTEWTQPAILTVSVAALEALRSRGFAVSAMAGHSLGEWSAHVAAGSLDFEEAVAAVRQRGRFMQEAVPVGQGAMAALVGLDPSEVEAVCAMAAQGEIVSPANYNGGGQVVIAGHASAVDRAMERARSEGARRAVKLPVSAPFHCALMEPAARRLRPVIEAMEVRDPSVPVWSNADAQPVSTAEGVRAALVRQVDAPVRWQEEIEGMVRSGVSTFVEIGPGRVLSGLVRRIAPQATVCSVSDPEGVRSALAQLEGAA
jgi:[acyl-carrier-protein] S-malonyltransferase